MLYKLVELPSDEPVTYVGVYVLKWGRTDVPTVAFREATPEEIAAQHRVQLTVGRLAIKTDRWLCPPQLTHNRWAALAQRK